MDESAEKEFDKLMYRRDFMRMEFRLGAVRQKQVMESQVRRIIERAGMSMTVDKAMGVIHEIRQAVSDPQVTIK
jgi:hypothetical protein